MQVYGGKGFRADLVAGLTVAAVAIPQGMAYALIAGVPARYGLYAAIVMTTLGSLLGSSKHLITGPTNAISLVVFSAVAGLGLSTVQQRVEAVFLLALMAGAIQVLIAFLKFGDLTRYVSESVILGFMLGAGILIVLSQVPNLLGLKTTADGHQHLLLRLWDTLNQGEMGLRQGQSVILGLGSMVVVVGLRWLGHTLRFPLPDMLLTLILASVVAWSAGWHQPAGNGAAVDGGDSNGGFGLPLFHLPGAELDWVPRLGWSALSIAMLGLLEALAIAKSIAVRTQQRLDYNRECLAQGLANLGGGLFQCLPGSGSLTRSAINYQAGAVSRASGVLSALAVGLCVWLLGRTDLTGYVPPSVLAGILVVTAWRLVDRTRLMYCLRATRFDAGLALGTAASAVFISIEFSILIGVFLSFLFFVPRAAQLRAGELVVSPERVVRERQPEDPPCAKMALLDLEGELFFGVAPELEAQFRELAERAKAGVRVIVLRLKRTRNPDMVCLEKLHHFVEQMQQQNVHVLLCGVRPDFLRALHNLGVQDWLSADCIFEEQRRLPEGGEKGRKTEGEEPREGKPELDSYAALPLSLPSSTLRAVRRGYDLLGQDLCPTCPRREELEQDKEVWYYMI